MSSRDVCVVEVVDSTGTVKDDTIDAELLVALHVHKVLAAHPLHKCNINAGKQVHACHCIPVRFQYIQQSADLTSF